MKTTIIVVKQLSRNFYGRYEDRINLNGKGLGFDGAVNTAIELSLETTKPFAIGTSWRPTRSAHITVEIVPPKKEVKLPNGQKYTPYSGNFFVRYSPDSKNWSSWQVLEPQKEKSVWEYAGNITVSQKESKKYQDYIYKYHKEDVPWKSDEEAAVKWILEKEPDFFRKGIPFIDYLQFLLETSLNGNQRIQKIKISVSSSVGGMSTIPKDGKYQDGRSSIPWRFKAK